MEKVKRLLFWFSVIVGGAAVLQQLKRPRDERTWHGAVMGVPYDFRPPSLGRMKDAWWDSDDPRLFTPRDFGVGWAINLPRLLQLARVTQAPSRHAADDSDDEDSSREDPA
jgi:hypothetical protein